MYVACWVLWPWSRLGSCVTQCDYGHLWAPRLCSVPWIYGELPHTLCPKWLFEGCCHQLGQLPQQCSQGQISCYPSQDKILGPTPSPGVGGGLPRGTGSLWASQAQGLACRLEGGQHIPGLGLSCAGLGNSCASPGQRLIEAPGLGGQAAVCAPWAGGRGWRALDLAHSQALSAWLATFWLANLWAPLSSPVSFKGSECASLGATEPAGEAVLQSALQLSGPGFGGLTPNCLLQRLSSVSVGLAWPQWNL